MNIGIIGLGKMGFNLALNIKDHGYSVMGYDLDQELARRTEQAGIKCAFTIEELLENLSAPRTIWLMVPAGDPVDTVLQIIKNHARAGDIVIDGGNSFYKDSIRRAGELALMKVSYLDCGTSGGVEGARHGVCAMIGGEQQAFKQCEKLFKDISVPEGYVYCGPSGSGHFVKMIHNGIEYGMMQSIAEGFEVMYKSDFGLNLEKIAHVWNHGSVVRSWLMELTERALSKDPGLASIKGIMRSSGEGKWTVETALEKQIATPVMALSLMMRYRSLEDDTFAGKVVAALRNEFGGHAVDKK